jgi:hypothetical protein
MEREMTQPTEKQTAFIRSLVDRILAVDPSKLPTKAKAPAPARYTFNPQENAIAAQALARDILAKLENGELTVAFASNCIGDLKVAARRAGA